MTLTPPEEQNLDEMAWPRSETDTGNVEPPETEDPVPEATEEAQRLERVLRDRTPHARRLTIDEDEADDENDVEQLAAVPVTAPAPVDPEILAALESEREERFNLQREADPIIAMMIVGAISIGATPLDAVVRYVVLWALLCMAGVLAYVLGRAGHSMRNDLDDLTAGIAFGMGIGLPVLIALGGPMADISARMFDADEVPRNLMDSWVFMAVVFVQPTAESLFFRGAMQQFRSLPLTAILATIWSVVLFFPHMGIGGFFTLALMIGGFFAFLNFLYSYVRFRNGLSAAWICQVVSGSLIWFFPRLLFG